MNRENLKKLDDNFRDFVQPLLNENEAEDFAIIWEFQKFLHNKKLKVLTAEHELTRRWKESLLNR